MSIDHDLVVLISKITAIQHELDPNLADKDKLSSMELGGGNSLTGGEGMFVVWRDRITDGITKLKGLVAKVNAAGAVSKRTKEYVTQQSDIRSGVKLLHDDWLQLDAIVKAETKKRRSKYSTTELNEQQECVRYLALEIENLQRTHRMGFIDTDTVAHNRHSAPRVGTAKQSGMFLGDSASKTADGTETNTTTEEVMTQGQQKQLLQLKIRDALIDQEIDLIGQGVDELKILASAINEEVTTQAVVLDRIEEKMDVVSERVVNVNTRMRETLAAVRHGDKICMDIICVIILVGMISLLIYLSEQNSK